MKNIRREIAELEKFVDRSRSKQRRKKWLDAREAELCADAQKAISKLRIALGPKHL